MNFDELEIGSIHLTAKDANYTMRCVQAAEDGYLSLVSVIGAQTPVRAFAATMQGNSKGRVEFSDIPGMHYCDKLGGAGNYSARMYRLGFGTFQCSVMVKIPNFLPCVSDETVYNLIRSDRYTTPICKEWIPHIVRELISRELLRKHASFQCSPGTLNASSEDLDDIVSRGLRWGKIGIPEETNI